MQCSRCFFGAPSTPTRGVGRGLVEKLLSSLTSTWRYLSLRVPMPPTHPCQVHQCSCAASRLLWSWRFLSEVAGGVLHASVALRLPPLCSMFILQLVLYLIFRLGRWTASHQFINIHSLFNRRHDQTATDPASRCAIPRAETDKTVEIRSQQLTGAVT